MNDNDQVSAGNIETSDPSLNGFEKAKLVEEMKFQLGAAAVTENLKRYVGEMLRRPAGTTILKEAMKSALIEKEDTSSETEPACSKDNGGSMQTEESTGVARSLKPVTAEILPSSSDQQPGDFERDNSQSLSIVDSSISLLHASMKKLLEPDQINPERRAVVETYTVSAAVKCADQIGKLMKVKLEAFKMRREFE